MSDEISIKFNCRDCGELVTWDENVSDEDIISCKGCGREFGTFGEIKAAGMRAAKDRLNETIEDAIKDTPWMKFDKKF
jgi:hypothetical protein